jgi:hypothetical protein
LLQIARSVDAEKLSGIGGGDALDGEGRGPRAADQCFRAPKFIHRKRVLGGKRKVIARVVKAAHGRSELRISRGAIRLNDAKDGARALGETCARRDRVSGRGGAQIGDHSAGTAPSIERAGGSRIDRRLATGGTRGPADLAGALPHCAPGELTASRAHGTS